MWKVLIADDEKKVCELIQYLVPWEQMGLEVTAVVSNGLEAIEVLKQETIDIVITDARMPECDGIELIKWCHQAKKNLKYIVISGYRHFEYAHGALQYGVDCYLLKPINQNELIHSLQKLIEKLEQEADMWQNNQKIQQRMSLDRDRLRRHFIGSYIFDGTSFCNRQIESAEEINDEYQTSFAEGIYQALFIKIDNVENVGYNMEKLLIKLKEQTEARLEGFGNEMLATMLHSGIMVLLNYPVEKEREFLQEVETLHEELEKTLDIFEGLSMTLGIGCKEYSICQINHCITTATDAIKYRIYLKKAIIPYENHPYRMVPREDVWTKEQSELLEKHIRNGNRDGVKKLLFDCCLQFRREKQLSPVLIFGILQEISRDMERLLSEVTEETVYDTVFWEFSEAMDQINTEEELWKRLEQLLESCMEVLEQELSSKQTRPFRIVKEYIEEHYAEPISLEMMAEKVNLSANYVSAMFRKEAGVTFLEYVTAKRMEVATELLRKTDLSIGEIAQRVGYGDVKYFSKLCKKTLGMKPSEYRKLYS